jgi:hypothetical protein
MIDMAAFVLASPLARESLHSLARKVLPSKELSASRTDRHSSA